MGRTNAINEDFDGRVATNALVGADILGNSAVDLGNRESSGVGVTKLFPKGGELLAVATPGGVELDDGDGVLLQERVKVGLIEDVDAALGNGGVEANKGERYKKGGELEVHHFLFQQRS